MDQNDEILKAMIDSLSTKVEDNTIQLGNMKYNYSNLVSESYVSSDSLTDILNEFNRSNIKFMSIIMAELYKDKYLVLKFYDRKTYIGKLASIEVGSVSSNKYTGYDGYTTYFINGTKDGMAVGGQEIPYMSIVSFDDDDSAKLYAELGD